MATCVLQGRMPESASENARAVAGRADRDAVSIDAVNATTAEDDSEAAAGQTSRPKPRRRIRPPPHADARKRLGASERRRQMSLWYRAALSTMLWPWRLTSRRLRIRYGIGNGYAVGLGTC